MYTFSDPKDFVLNPGLLISKKKECILYVFLGVYFYNNKIGNASFISISNIFNLKQFGSSQ